MARKGKKIFGSIYRVDRAGDRRPRFVELVETWDLATNGGVTLCLPISIGCPNSCRMCDLGTYYGGNLTGEEMQTLIELNLAADYGIPVRGERAPMIYYLGGGDAALNPSLVETISAVRRARPACRQVVSTIGLDVDGQLSRMVEELALVGGTGFQISVCAFNEAARQKLIDYNNHALSVTECIGLVHQFFDRSGRRGYLSIFLVRELYDDVERIFQDVVSLVDPRKVHITLTVLRRNELPMTQEGAALECYEELRGKLENAGFEVSISTNDEDLENSVSCGVMESDVLLNNRIFSKSRHLQSSPS